MSFSALGSSQGALRQNIPPNDLDNDKQLVEPETTLEERFSQALT